MRGLRVSGLKGFVEERLPFANSLPNGIYASRDSNCWRPFIFRGLSPVEAHMGESPDSRFRIG
jgi:hypothetical protein